MKTTNRKRIAVALLAGMGVAAAVAQSLPDPAGSLAVDHAECALFGPMRDKLIESGLAAQARRRYGLSELTAQVVPMLGGAGKGRNYIVPGGSRTDVFQQLDSLGVIDYHLFKAMQDAQAQPAPRSTDYEFCRRVTFDLIGRAPSLDRLQRFVADPDPQKRARYIDELMARPEWVDKWQMFFSDLLENSTNNNQVNRFADGRNAFYNYIRDSLAANKRYNVMVTEMLTASTGNTYESGQAGFILGGFVTGSPRGNQDIFDQLAANTAEKFLGIAHQNCIICHDGRGHIETLSVWGRRATRLEAYGLASFFSRTNHRRIRVNPDSVNPYYYAIEDNTVFRTDYPLNTTTGNRPPREPIGSIRNVAPEYPFGDKGKPNPGESHRAALARLLTNDIQFARATVNYIWKQFFVRGIVEPANQFDLARLDPDNPPAAPWTIQPTHPALLNALARDFVENGFDLKDLMRKIANSEAYQLSSRYEGTWKPEYETLFARKFVRRLWGEEVMDAIVQTSNIANAQLNVNGLGRLSWAMQLPDTFRLPNDAVGSFLDSFLRGNRIDEDRRLDGSVPQALNLMNDPFVHTRTRASGTGAAASLARQLLTRYAPGNDAVLVREMFLTVLNRPPSDEELNGALAAFARAAGNAARQAQVEDLLWALYNKVDFVYNY